MRVYVIYFKNIYLCLIFVYNYYKQQYYYTHTGVQFCYFNTFIMICNCCLKVFVFSTTHKNWQLYNWSKLTTLVEVGYHDDEMVKYAHSRNVTVSYIGII